MFQTDDEGAALFVVDELRPPGRHTKAQVPVEKDALLFGPFLEMSVEKILCGRAELSSTSGRSAGLQMEILSLFPDLGLIMTPRTRLVPQFPPSAD